MDVLMRSAVSVPVNRAVAVLRPARLLALAALLLLATGCATTKSFSSVSNLEPSTNSATPLKIALMPLDVQLSILTAGGTLEPQADWTRDAKDNMISALQRLGRVRNNDFIVYQEPAQLDATARKILEIERLHRAVGQSILFHKYLVPLPTKKSAFDWTLGPEVSVLHDQTGADYALFIHVEDSYSSKGRIFMQLAAAALGIGLQGGQQAGFTSLVDLHSGNIVWFNFINNPAGDLRTPKPAEKTVQLLLKGLPE